MMIKGKRQREPGNRAVTVLATSIVIVLGMLTCLAVSVSSIAVNHYGPWICLACFTGIVLIVWGVFAQGTDKPEGDRSILFFWRARQKQRDDYVVVRRKELPPEDFSEPAPKPQPPSVESVRRIREEHAVKTWVPVNDPRPPRGDSRR